MDTPEHTQGLSTGFDANAPRVLRGEEATSSVTWGEVYDDQVIENHLVPNIIRRTSRDLTVDPDYTPDVDRVLREYEALGIPVEGHERWVAEFADVGNEKEHSRLMDRHLEKFQSEQRLAELGGAKALGAVMASYASDPASVLVDAMTGGATKGGFLLRLLKGGSQATVANGVVEAVLAADGESVDPTDVAVGFASAAILGGAFGAAFGARPGDDLLDAHNTLVKGLREEAKSDSPGPTSGDDSVGAQRNPVRPDVSEDIDAANSRLDALRDEIDPNALAPSGFGNIRFDMAAQVLRSPSAAVRHLGGMLFSNPINKDISRVNRTAGEERSQAIFGQAHGELSKAVEPLLGKWYQKTRGTGKIGGVLKRAFDPDAEAEFFTLLGDYRASGRTLEVPDEIKSADAAMTRFYSTMADHIRRVDPEARLRDPSEYMPQRMSRRRYNEAFEGIGERHELLPKLIAKGIKAHRERLGLDIDDELTEIVAKAYGLRIRRQGESGDSFGSIDRDFLDLEDRDLLEELIEESGLEAEDVSRLEKALDRMTSTAKAQASSDKIDPLQSRLEMDKNVSIKVDAGDGTEREIFLRDMFDNNANDLMFNYGRMVAGDVALRERGSSAREMRKLLTELHREAVDSDTRGGVAGAATKRDVELLDVGYRATMGMPLEDNIDSSFKRLARVATGVGYVTKMGAAGFNAVAEAFSVLAYAGTVRTLKNLPAFKDVLKDMAHGGVDSPLYREVQMLTGGLGDTLVRNMAGFRHQYDSSFVGHDKLGAVEKGLEGLKKLSTYGNGLSFVTDVSRKYMAVNAMSQLDDILYRGTKAPSWWDKRRLSWDMDDARMERVQRYLKSDMVERGRGGELKSLGNMPDDVRVALEEYMYRYVSEGIQQVHTGNLPKMMTSSLGRVVFQFRGFITGGHVRHFAKDMKYMDSLAATKFAWTTASAALAYTARVYASYPTNEDKREEMLRLDRIGRTASAYAVNSALLPAVADTLALTTLGSPVFAKSRASGLNSGVNILDASSFVGSNPSLNYIGDVGTTLGIPGALVRGGSLSRSQARAMFNVVGLDTMWFLRGGKNALLDQLPKTSEDTEKPISFFDED